MSLVERINSTVESYDPWGYRDSDCSLEHFEELLRDEPAVIIEGLLDMIDELRDCWTNAEARVQDLQDKIRKMEVDKCTV